MKRFAIAGFIVGMVGALAATANAAQLIDVGLGSNPNAPTGAGVIGTGSDVWNHAGYSITLRACLIRTVIPRGCR